MTKRLDTNFDFERLAVVDHVWWVKLGNEKGWVKGLSEKVVKIKAIKIVEGTLETQ